VISLIPKIKILVNLIILPGISSSQPLFDLTVLSTQEAFRTASYGMHCVRADISNTPKLGQGLLPRHFLVEGLVIEGLCQSTIDYIPTSFTKLEPFEYQIEDVEHNSYLLDDSFAIRSPGADYNSSGLNDIDSSLSVLSNTSIDPTFLAKPLQLLILLAGEDLTLYEAADTLRISVHTANKYVAKIKLEFGVLTLPAAVLYAAKEGYIPMSSKKL